MLGKIFAALLGGFVISILGSMVVGLSVGAGEEGGSIGGISFFVFYVYSFVISLRSSSTIRAWKWLLINSAILCFLLPISSMLFTGIFIAEETSGAAEAAGGFLGGTLVTIIAGFFGFFLGVIFLVIGLLVGNTEKEIQS